LGDIHIYESTHEVGEEEARIAEPTSDIELVVSMSESTPDIELEEVPMNEPAHEFPTEEVPVVELTDKITTEEPYILISKNFPVTEESKKDLYVGSGLILQQARE
jgi:hypothetical protein